MTDRLASVEEDVELRMRDRPLSSLGRSVEGRDPLGEPVLAEEVVGVEEGDVAPLRLRDDRVTNPAEVAFVHLPALPVVEPRLVEVVAGRRGRLVQRDDRLHRVVPRAAASATASSADRMVGPHTTVSSCAVTTTVRSMSLMAFATVDEQQARHLLGERGLGALTQQALP